MRSTLSLFILLGVAMVANGQQMINTTTPLNQIGSSFYENTGVKWSIRGPNFFANFGGAALPPFGNPDPNSGLRTGVGFSNGRTSGNLGFTFAQGSNRTITSSAPSVTTMNGVPGSFTSQTIRPFVTGITPIVGDYPRFGVIPAKDNKCPKPLEPSKRSFSDARLRRTRLGIKRHLSTSTAASGPRRKETRRWREQITGWRFTRQKGR